MAEEIPDLLAHLDMTCRHGVDLDMDECDECAARPVSQGTEDSPDVVTICGSMRFRDLMLKVAAEETSAGRIVLMPFAVVAQADQGSDFKAMLDTLHRRKIDMADRVIVVMDESGYYGESTRGEIEYASKLGKVVSFQTVEAEPLKSPAENERRPAEDSDYREQIARVVESHAPHDRVSEWQDINSTVTAVLAVPHPDTAEAARLREKVQTQHETIEGWVQYGDRIARRRRDLSTEFIAALGRQDDLWEPVETQPARVAALRAERDRLRLAWQSAARGRMRARIERDRQQRQVEMHMGHRNEIQGFLDGVLGTEPEDGAGEGFVADVMLAVRRIQGDLSVARRVLDEVTKKALWLESETQHLRAGLETRTRERDDRESERDLALAQRNEERRVRAEAVDWLAGVNATCAAVADAAGLDPEEADGEALVAAVTELRESRFRWAEEAARLESERDYLAWLHAEAAHLLSDFLTVQCSSAVDGVRALVARCDAAELEWRTARDVAARAFVFPQGWERQVVAVLGDLAGRDLGRLLGSWRAAPVEAETTLAETRTGIDWCPNCRTEASTDRFRDDGGTERCGTCGSDLSELVVGVDYQPGCSNRDCDCWRPRRPCKAAQCVDRVAFCARCGWHKEHHPRPEPHPTEADLQHAFRVLERVNVQDPASPGTGTEAGE